MWDLCTFSNTIFLNKEVIRFFPELYAPIMFFVNIKMASEKN